MKKNVAGQKIGAQLVSATDGSDFTGAATVSVTGDAGAQATGSVGSGACTHEGKGYHTYAPAQAETDYDLIAFTFQGSGAITVTVQVFTTFPQTGDSFARLGAPAGASIAVDIAAIKTVVDAVKAKTDQLIFTIANKIDASIQAAGDFAQAAADKVWSTAARALTDKAGFALSAAGVQAIWDALTAALTTANSIGKLMVDNINATIASRLASAGYTTPPTADQIGDDVEARTLNANIVSADPSSIDAAAIAGDVGPEIASSVWAFVVEGSYTAVQYIRGIAAALMGKASGMNTTTAVLRDTGDTKDRITATVDANGNRSAVTLDLT